MNILVLTQYGGKILGPIARFILGPILNAIFNLLNLVGIPNIGLSIILFTIVIYLLMLPLTIKQQKFSKLQAKMQPELQAIQNKYKDKRDQDSQLAMNQETQAVYAKYGVSPVGSCLQLLIQMPILFALYRVIYAIPAYVTKIGETFMVLANKVYETDNGAFLFTASGDDFKNLEKAVSMYARGAADIMADTEKTETVKNFIIDVLNKASSKELILISQHYGLSDLTYNGKQIISSYDAGGKIVTKGLIDIYNNFLGINIGNTPSDTIKNAFSEGQYLLIVGAILIPVLAAVTQWLNVKLTPQQQNNNNSNPNDQSAQMAQSMKMMNTFMPIFSAVMCFTFPAGVGIYWIAGSVVRSIQQVAVNKYIDKMDIDDVIKKNLEKKNERLKKAGIDPNKISANANRSTRAVERLTKIKEENEAKVKEAQEKALNSGSKGGSIAAKANMVKKYNEKNNK